MSSMVQVNHGPQLRDEENYPLDLRKKVEIAGVGGSINLYMSSHVTGAGVRVIAKGK